MIDIYAAGVRRVPARSLAGAGRRNKFKSGFVPGPAEPQGDTSGSRRSLTAMDGEGDGGISAKNTRWGPVGHDNMTQVKSIELEFRITPSI